MEILCALINFSCSLHRSRLKKFIVVFLLRKSQQFFHHRQMYQIHEITLQPLLINWELSCSICIALIYGEMRCCNLIRLIFTINCIRCLHGIVTCAWLGVARAAFIQAERECSLWIIFSKFHIFLFTGAAHVRWVGLTVNFTLHKSKRSLDFATILISP